MVPNCIQHIVCFLICSLGIAFSGYGQVRSQEQHVLVSLRMIGHQVLLQSGDSTSRVLPIEKTNGQYKISFASDFSFSPEKLVSTIDSIVLSTGIAESYFIEVQDCTSEKIVYSYEVGSSDTSDVIPCKARTQKEGCYSILFTIIDKDNSMAALKKVAAKPENNRSAWVPILPIAVVLLALIGLYRLKNRKNQSTDPGEHLIQIGVYQFDKRNMVLIFNEDRIELTGKESNLLSLLHEFVNTTVERHTILNTVWGDEGDYVGRTLDVFISKLRKKLENDTNVKIVNIRGVGYKLVLNS